MPKEILPPKAPAIAYIFSPCEKSKLIDHLNKHKVDYVVAISLDGKAARDDDFCDRVTEIVEASTMQMLTDFKTAKSNGTEKVDV
jgi:hypothetical protein